MLPPCLLEIVEYLHAGETVQRTLAWEVQILVSEVHSGVCIPLTF